MDEAWLRALVAASLGLMIGSFLTVVVDRVPKKESVVRPRSRCPACGAGIRARDNIPLVSWLVLRGRCRDCGDHVAVRGEATDAIVGHRGLRRVVDVHVTVRSEVRVDGDQWFLDTFIKSGEDRLTLYADKFKHPLGRWYHVALVFDGTKMTHYVEGQEEMSGALRIAPLVTGKTSLGVRMNRVYWFKGAISRARFTARALTPNEFIKK